MGTIKRVIGDPIRTTDGHEYTVTSERWANEAPDAVTLDGHACMVIFDPGYRVGRIAMLDLIANLNAALADHDQIVEQIYGELQVGDDAGLVRLAHGSETQCTFPLGDTQCHRPEHADRHHVAVNGDYVVIAVAHTGRQS